MRVIVTVPNFISLRELDDLNLRAIWKLKKHGLDKSYEVSESNMVDDNHFLEITSTVGIHIPKSWCKEVDPFAAAFDSRYGLASTYIPKVGETKKDILKEGWDMHQKYCEEDGEF